MILVVDLKVVDKNFMEEKKEGEEEEGDKFHSGLVFYPFRLPSLRLSSFDSSNTYSCQACCMAVQVGNGTS